MLFDFKSIDIFFLFDFYFIFFCCLFVLVLQVTYISSCMPLIFFLFRYYSLFFLVRTINSIARHSFQKKSYLKCVHDVICLFLELQFFISLLIFYCCCYLSIQDHYHLCHFDNAMKLREQQQTKQKKKNVYMYIIPK